jgi:cardiolipin synthase A/B
MRLPKARNVVLTILAVLAVIAVGLLIAQDQETLRVRTPVAVEDPRFPQYLARLLGHSLTDGNTVAVYADGPASFDAKLAAIERARDRISFETYIYDAGTVGERFTAAFEAACRRGIAVRMVLDSLGAQSMATDHRTRLEEAGCSIGWFNPLASFSLEEANYRTHRKALVVDGEVAFVGGIGIGDQWAEDSETFPRWRDTHFELRGPVALDIEGAFHENWIETGGIVQPDLLAHDESPAGTAQAITVWSSPEGGTNAMKLLYLMTIAASRQTLDIQSPYLITDASTEWSLLDARRRGVRIRLLVEGEKTDAKPVKFAGRARYEPLLAAGIEIHEYQPTMMHTKALMADGYLSIIGSANFDNRSFELNDELNVVVFDRDLAEQLIGDFERDLEASVRLTLEEWRARPLHIRARERLWGFFGELF